VLGFLVLADDHQAGRNVGDAHGGVRRVDALAAGAGRTVDVDAQVIGIDGHVDFRGLGHDGHGDGRGVDAALGFGGGHALDAVGAGFVFEAAVDLVPGDGGDDFLEPAGAGFRGAHHLHFPVLGLGVAGVHAEEIAGEKRRFLTAGPGPDFQEDVFFIHGIGGQQQDFQLVLQLGDGLPDGFDFGLGQFPHFGVRVLGQFLVFLQVLGELFVFPKVGHHFREVGVGLGQFAEALLVGDDFGIGQLFFQLYVFAFETFEFGEHAPSPGRAWPGPVLVAHPDAATTASGERCSITLKNMAMFFKQRRPATGFRAGKGSAGGLAFHRAGKGGQGHFELLVVGFLGGEQLEKKARRRQHATGEIGLEPAGEFDDFVGEAADRYHEHEL